MVLLNIGIYYINMLLYFQQALGGRFMLKRITSILVSALILVTAVGLSSCGDNKNSKSSSKSSKVVIDDSKTRTSNNLTTKVKDGAILHCFCWDFKTIENSLEDIAAQGFSSIQTSPINECLEGENGGMQLYGDGKWYYHFQPTDYTIGNYQLGTRDEFKSMCKKADELGIKVIVDVVPNHTTPTTDKINKNLIDAVGGLDKLYHDGNSKDIMDWGNRLQCTTYKMGGLPDINTENKDFQDYFIKYLNDCIECGADGFRYDAAKHIGLPDDPKENGRKNNFWTRVTSEITDADRIFNYGEVLQGSNDRISDYIDTIGACTASSYGGYIRQGITSTSISSAKISDLRVGSSSNCVTWVESHDNYINDGNWSQMDDNQVLLGYAIIAARDGGTPLFFDRPMGNSVENQWGTENRIGTNGDLFYKNDVVRAVNFFRNAMVGEENDFIDLDENGTALEICRGKKGAVIIKTAFDLKGKFKTDLPDGTYVNRVDNKTEYTVKGGKLICDKPIPAESVVVLYNDNYADNYAPATVKFDDGAQFVTDGDFSAKLVSENSVKSTYKVNDGEEKEFKNGDSVTVKADEMSKGTATVELFGENDKGVHSYVKYIITNKKAMFEGKGAKKGDTITFTKPDSWGNSINAYIYYGDNQEAAWPGNAMTKKDGNTYTYELQNDWDMGYVIFNDGTEQYPGQNEQGLDLESGGKYSVD